jgi:MFS family permease
MTTFVRRPVLTTNIATLLIGPAMISTFVLVPQLGQLPKGGEIGFGLSAAGAALLLAPGGLAALLVAPLVGRVGERGGSKAPLLAGCLLVAVALLGLALAHDSVGPIHPLELPRERRLRCRLRGDPQPHRHRGLRLRDR